jgi:two-component system, NtrC family, response regulator AtoC
MASEKILVVDDERLMRWSLRQKCEEWDFLVFEAESGEAALRHAQLESPDLILLDVRLPDVGGLELLGSASQKRRRARSGDDYRRPATRSVKTSLKLGAQDFVGKPIDFDELQVVIKNALETNRLRSGSAIPAR